MIFFVKSIHFSDIYNKKNATVYKDDRTRSVQTGKIRCSRNFLQSKWCLKSIHKKINGEHVSAISPCTGKRIAFSPTVIPQ
jgi:hypothetical protein